MRSWLLSMIGRLFGWQRVRRDSNIVIRDDLDGHWPGNSLVAQRAPLYGRLHAFC